MKRPKKKKGVSNRNNDKKEDIFTPVFSLTTNYLHLTGNKLSTPHTSLTAILNITALYVTDHE